MGLQNDTFSDVLSKWFHYINATDNDNEFIVIDPETGIVRDINTDFDYCGAYCYSGGQTVDAINYGWKLKSADQIRV